MTEEEIQQILTLLSKPQPKIAENEFRLYYDEKGNVITYTCEKLPGNYIVVTKEQYNEARNDAVVKDGILTYTHKTTHCTKYVKNKVEGIKTSKYDINILTDNIFNCWKIQTYEIK